MEPSIQHSPDLVLMYVELRWVFLLDLRRVFLLDLRRDYILKGGWGKTQLLPTSDSAVTRVIWTPGGETCGYEPQAHITPPLAFESEALPLGQLAWGGTMADSESWTE